MIQIYTTTYGKTLYKVRVYVRSSTNPDLRVTRQESGIESHERAIKLEAQLKKLERKTPSPRPKVKKAK